MEHVREEGGGGRGARREGLRREGLRREVLRREVLTLAAVARCFGRRGRRWGG